MTTVIEFMILKKRLRRTEIESGFPRMSRHFPLKRGLDALVIFETILAESRRDKIIQGLEPMFKYPKTSLQS